jgi:hypothetical protein
MGVFFALGEVVKDLETLHLLRQIGPGSGPHEVLLSFLPLCTFLVHPEDPPWRQEAFLMLHISQNKACLPPWRGSDLDPVRMASAATGGLELPLR